MKPTSISYSESKESFDITTGLKSWRKAGVEIELDDVDDIEHAFREAKSMVNAGLYPIDTNKINGHLLNEPPYNQPTPLPTIDYSAKEKVEKEIESCTTLKEWTALFDKVTKHGLVPQYLEKKKKL